MNDLQDLGEIKIPESDGISCIRFWRQNNDYIAFSTWDGKLHTYDTREKRILKSFSFECPLLSCEWAEHTFICGGADGAISANGKQIGAHEDAVSSLAYSAGTSQIISGSFDSTVKTWDLRTPNLIADLKVQNKIYSLCTMGPYSVICGCGNQTIFTFDTRRPEKGKLTKSPLQYNISCVCATDDMYAIGSFEGRVGICDSRDNTFSFKAHFKVEDDAKLIYSTNAMCFNPKTQDLATGGGDGKIIIWDLEKKKERLDIGPFNTSISSLDFSPSGDMLIAAISYCYENGNIDHPKDSIRLFACK